MNIYHFFTYNIVSPHRFLSFLITIYSSQVAVIVESALAHAAAVVQSIEVVVGLAPSHLLRAGGNGRHVVANYALVELVALGHLAVLVLDAASNLLVVVGKHLVVSKVAALPLVLLHDGRSLGQVRLVQLEVTVLRVQFSLQFLNLLVSRRFLLLRFDLHARERLV